MIEKICIMICLIMQFFQGLINLKFYKLIEECKNDR